METKRKVTFEQSQALEFGRHVARTNQRRRVAAKQAALDAERERARQAALHVHRFSNWDYVFNADGTTDETRKCQCGETETRPFKL